MKSSLMKPVVLGACAIALVVFSSTALAGSSSALNTCGQAWLLGNPNSCNTTTSLSGTTAAPQLQVNNASSGSSAYAIAANSAGGAPAISGGNTGAGSGSRGISVNNVGAVGIHSGTSGTAAGVRGDTFSTDVGATGVLGRVFSTSPGSDSAGVRGINNGTGGNGIGVYGSQNGSGWGVYGTTPRGIGVYGKATDGWGVWGSSTNSYGGRFSGYIAVLGEGRDRGGIFSGNVAGVEAAGNAGGGAFQAYAAGGTGVVGEADGMNATSGPPYGVWGISNNPSGYAGFFTGNVNITGTLTKGAGAFRIDDPLDPAHAYLQHSFVESPDMMNVYNGNVTTDAHGFATVRLPRYFQALNRDFRYQLTIVGTRGWRARVVKEIRDNRFTIQTDEAKVKVSWQVTGIRHDPYANAHRIKVHLRKPARAQGFYLHPGLYEKPATKSVEWALKPRAMRALARAHAAARPTRRAHRAAPKRLNTHRLAQQR
jgi:hypothetical protein